MKWTTANFKSPNYTENHEIYVGTHTGTFKKLVPAYEKNPFAQQNLQELSNLTKESRITTLEFGNAEKSEILIGRATNQVQLYSLRREAVEQKINLELANVAGLARFDNHLVAGFSGGEVQRVLLQEDEEDESIVIKPDHSLKSGDNISHMRQCSVQRNLVATGGKARQNNLKVFDMEVGKQIFTSKNLPNDYLQLEVPIWDSDVGFIDAPNILATCSRYGYVRVYDTRKQRRPIQCYATEDQLSFATLAARGNYIYAGTTMGALKAFDIRRMKNFVHTYKGFTGSISDIYLNESGKYLCSASLDRYVRVHHVDSCVMLYQCYVKSKATRVLLRESMENPNNNANEAAQEEENEEETVVNNGKASKPAVVDKEYDDIFDKMQTVREANEEEDESDDELVVGDEDVDDESEHEHASSSKIEANAQISKSTTSTKRKNVENIAKNKKKK